LGVFVVVFFCFFYPNALSHPGEFLCWAAKDFSRNFLTAELSRERAASAACFSPLVLSRAEEASGREKEGGKRWESKEVVKYRKAGRGETSRRERAKVGEVRMDEERRRKQGRREYFWGHSAMAVYSPGTGLARVLLHINTTQKTPLNPAPPNITQNEIVAEKSPLL